MSGVRTLTCTLHAAWGLSFGDLFLGVDLSFWGRLGSAFLALFVVGGSLWGVWRYGVGLLEGVGVCAGVC